MFSSLNLNLDIMGNAEWALWAKCRQEAATRRLISDLGVLPILIDLWLNLID
jgi:hypothetical protein